MPNDAESFEIVERCQEDPAFFFREVLKLPTFEWEGKELTHTPEIMSVAEHVRDHEETYVKSGNGTGKTHGCASIDLWFLFSFENSIVLLTAPTERQVREILFSEIGRQYRKYLGGEMTYLKIDIDENWKMIGFTARESTDHEKMAARMQGFHAQHMLVHFDEAPGVHPAFWKAKDRVLTGVHVRFLAVGNPTSPSGDFYDGCLRHKAITISCLSHPNVISGKEIIPGAVTRQWVEARREEWGESSPLFKSCVLGEFPDEGEDTLIPLSQLTSAVEKDDFEIRVHDIKALGVDVARFGNDSTVLITKHGRNTKPGISFTGKDLNWTIAKIKELDEIEKHDVILIDDVGVGGGVTDALKGWTRKSDGKSPRIIPVNVAESPIGFFDNVEFENLKAELAWLLKFDFQRGEIKISDEGRIISDTAAIKYDYTPRQKIAIRSKEWMRRKGLKSPDWFDALVLANYGTHQKPEMTAKRASEKSPGIVGNIIDTKF